MQSIEAIELNRLVIHGINNLAEEPEIAEKEEVLSEGLRHFFEEHIRNCVKSPSAKTAKFNGSDTTISTCAVRMIEAPDTFVEQSKLIGMWFSHQMAKSSQVQTFLAIGLFTDLDTEIRYVALLKMDAVRAYVKHGSGAGAFEQIQILPDPTRQLLRFAIARPYDDETRFDVLFRNQPASKDEDPETSSMWLDAFLEAAEVATPRQMTQLVVKETEKWLQQNEAELEEKETELLRSSVRTLAQTEEIDVEAIAAAALKDEDKREQYIGRLLDKGLTETTFQPDREWAERTARKTTYLCDYGVQISGPSDSIDDVIQILPKTVDRKTRVAIETRKWQQK
ncbi:MAG: nucleoid-associated protein [Armatimonadetes bacterium]|nr:nucleoid-associated protein [Armatimonadota bacterium]